MYLILRWGMTVISLAAVCTFGWGTFQQIKGQAETNEEMKRVAESVKKANELTAITVERLRPLEATAHAMQAMNRDLAATGQLLKEMNDGLARVTNSERVIVANLTGLNSSITATRDEIKRLSDTNSQLATLSSRMGTQVAQEHGSIRNINGLTATSNAELRTLNEKFAVLRVLP